MLLRTYVYIILQYHIVKTMHKALKLIGSVERICFELKMSSHLSRCCVRVYTWFALCGLKCNYICIICILYMVLIIRSTLLLYHELLVSYLTACSLHFQTCWPQFIFHLRPFLQRLCSPCVHNRCIAEVSRQIGEPEYFLNNYLTCRTKLVLLYKSITYLCKTLHYFFPILSI